MTINEPKQEQACEWVQDDDGCDYYSTQCGHYFSMIEGTPTDNQFKFCCFCGKKLLETAWTDDAQ